jgi:hypothetical protein
MTTGILLTVEDLANELGCNPVEGARLVARGFLKGTNLGDDGDYRITSASLEAFVLAGANNLTLPEMAGDWFDHSLSPLSEAFASAIIVASGEQFDDARIKQDFRNQPSKDSIDYIIAFSGKVLELCGRTVPDQVWGNTPTGTRNTRFSTWADLYLTEQLRNQARANIETADLGATLFDKLYGSPAQFATITDKTYADVAKRRIVASRMVMVNGLDGQDRIARFMFPLSNIVTPGAKARLIGLAF